MSAERISGEDLQNALDKVCEGVGIGLSVQKACEAAGINGDTFYRHLRLNSTLAENYTRARESRAHVRFEKLQDYLDKVVEGQMEPHAARVVLDAIKWQCGRELGKVYGDGLILRGDKDNPLDLGLAALLDAVSQKRKEIPHIKDMGTIIDQSPEINQNAPCLPSGEGAQDAPRSK